MKYVFQLSGISISQKIVLAKQAEAPVGTWGYLLCHLWEDGVPRKQA